MCWVEADRVQMRLYLGSSALWLQADPRLEGAMTVVQSVSCPGGSRPDNSTELAIRSVIADLQCIDKQRLELSAQAGAVQVGTTRLDAVREDARLRALGRSYVHRLGRFLDTKPRADIYSAAETDFRGYPNAPIGDHDPYTP